MSYHIDLQWYLVTVLSYSSCITVNRFQAQKLPSVNFGKNYKTDDWVLEKLLKKYYHVLKLRQKSFLYIQSLFLTKNWSKAKK